MELSDRSDAYNDYMLRMRRYGDKALRRKAKPVREINEKVKSLAEEMTALMQANRGVGLAANQVGELLRVIVIDSSGGERKKSAFVLINPKVTRQTGKFSDEEGCLCFPGLRLFITRPMEVTVEGLDISGNPVIIEGRGLLARILMHETDHLDGRLFIDRLPFLKRLSMLPQFFKLKRKYRLAAEKEERGSEAGQ